ncbi:hypothetical protein BJF79_18360 [Actinomadura sp. CNU-125]|uniref:hypothetical protein n=1 Tax=Actinomadura sp. CNU-125 TaxID=1904961 RepID=UPI00095CF055|nr:hypothetical protein [Actinomadura sp. CNU-125]OLT16579.1 hypothetical protein BJF79_18360 [Actinomadura sp. CNU-125]
MKADISAKPEAGGDGDAPAVYEYGLTFVAGKGGGSNGSARRRPPKVPAAVLAASFGKAEGEPEDKAGAAPEEVGEDESAGTEEREDAGKGAGGKRGLRRRRVRFGPRTRVALRVVPTVALVAVTAGLAVVWQDRNDLAGEADTRRELVGAASKVAGTFFNWDYRRMDESFKAKYPLLTEKAADSIRPTAETLTTYFTKNKVSSQAHINDIYPGEIKDGAANVLVVINTKVTTVESVQSNTGATVALSMERTAGRWLAGNITLLSPGAESVTDENGKPLSGADGEDAEGSEGAKGSGGSGLPGAGGLPGTAALPSPPAPGRGPPAAGHARPPCSVPTDPTEPIP